MIYFPSSDLAFAKIQKRTWRNINRMIVYMLLQNRNVDFAEGAAGALPKTREQYSTMAIILSHPMFTHAIPW